MVVGSLGKVIFMCSSYYIKTFNNLSINKNARWSEQIALEGKPRLNFQGINLETLKFDIHLNSAFHVEPMSAAKELEQYLDTGKSIRFILGGKVLGKYVITSISKNPIAYSPIGTITKMDISLELKEYN